MIAKAVKGGGFRGAAEYDLNKEKGRIISSNMAGETPRELAAEFGQIRALRPTLGKAVLHVSLSAAPGEKLTDEQWQAIGERYLQGMGFTDNQYIMTRHTDTEHEHIHILANRITMAGAVVSDSQDYKRQETIMREIERDYGLERVAPSAEAQRKAPTKGEIEEGIRTGQPSARQQLQQLADAAAKDCKDFTTYAERLEAVGVALVPVVQKDGAKLAGLSYVLDGVTMKGSDLGRGYTGAGIQKRGISYEQNRDAAAIRRSQERAADRAFGQPDTGREDGQNPERGGLGHGVGAAGPGDGRIDGRDTPDAGRDRPAGPGIGREGTRPDAGRGQDVDRGSGAGAEVSGQPGQGGAAHRVEPLPAIGDGGRNYSGSRERIMGLAGTSADSAPDAGRPGRGGAAETRRDRSLEAVERQVAALDAGVYRVGVRDAKTGQMMNRTWQTAELMASVAWLNRMNAKGNDIYIRPAGDHGLVLVDDLKPAALARMASEGFAPAATVETSPGNYQAWVKLSDKPVSADVRAVVARSLAQRYGGDMNSADAQHYGRLAGFTNQKPKHARNGKQPFVLAHECLGKLAKQAVAAIQAARDAIDRVGAKKERERRLDALEGYKSPGHGWTSDPGHEYQRQAQRLMQRYGRDTDLSRMDWMIAVGMAKSGRFSAEGIGKAIGEHSPNVESRKAGHIEDYARRTAEKAWSAPEVQAHRVAEQKRQEVEAQARQAQRARPRGPSMGR